MKVRCECGGFHEISTTALALIISAFRDGDLQRIGPNGIEPLCFEVAFTDARIARFVKQYPGTIVRFSKAGQKVPSSPVQIS